ncbi:hypothetical protein JTE90_014124 [Oedothorax gibbosus]|uniref:Secreted protein n=1 Tax=Oedothorax gibbosus TaxID=931172 RepID=A0AAV6U540_9ARAC|nr:hypothetical protein JTE90_014124 [Oedothorax gibbosus]
MNYVFTILLLTFLLILWNAVLTSAFKRICLVYYIGFEYHPMGCQDGQICNEVTRSYSLIHKIPLLLNRLLPSQRFNHMI